MTGYEFAWAMYLVGSLGCGIAAWLLLRRFGSAWSQFAFVTVLALLLTPYAMNAKEMIMAPALFIIVFGTLEDGISSVMPIIMVLLGVWLVGLILALLLQLLSRRFIRTSRIEDHPAADDSAYDESSAVTEVPEPETRGARRDRPIRAFR